MNLSTLRALALGLAITAPGLALAQSDTPPPPPPPGQGAGHWDHGSMDHGMRSYEARHIKAMHDILGIKPDQEAAFQAYASALHPAMPGPGDQGPGMDDHMARDHAAMAGMTTPERLDLMGKMMDEHHEQMRAHFERMASATKALYADLTPEQKRIMDTLPELTHGMGHDMEHGGMDHMDHMHGGPGSMGTPPPPSGAGR